MSRQTFTRFLRNPSKKIRSAMFKTEGGLSVVWTMFKKLQIWWRGASLSVVQHLMIVLIYLMIIINWCSAPGDDHHQDCAIVFSIKSVQTCWKSTSVIICFQDLQNLLLVLSWPNHHNHKIIKDNLLARVQIRLITSHTKRLK